MQVEIREEIKILQPNSLFKHRHWCYFMKFCRRFNFSLSLLSALFQVMTNLICYRKKVECIPSPEVQLRTKEHRLPSSQIPLETLNPLYRTFSPPLHGACGGWNGLSGICDGILSALRWERLVSGMSGKLYFTAGTFLVSRYTHTAHTGWALHSHGFKKPLIVISLHRFHHLSSIFHFTLWSGRFTEAKQYNWFGYNVVAPFIPNDLRFYLLSNKGSRRYSLHPMCVNTGVQPWEIQNLRNTESSLHQSPVHSLQTQETQLRKDLKTCGTPHEGTDSLFNPRTLTGTSKWN